MNQPLTPDEIVDPNRLLRRTGDQETGAINSGLKTWRRLKALELRRTKPPTPWHEIARVLHYKDAYQATSDQAMWRLEMRKELKEAILLDRELALMRLDDLADVAETIMRTQHLAMHQGVPVTIVDSETGQRSFLNDFGPVLAAMDRLLAIEDRRAKLQGTYQLKVEHSGPQNDSRFEVVISGVDTNNLS